MVSTSFNEAKVKPTLSNLEFNSNRHNTNLKFFSFLVVIIILHLVIFLRMLMLFILVVLVIRVLSMLMLFFLLRPTLKHPEHMLILRVEFKLQAGLSNLQDIPETAGKS